MTSVGGVLISLHYAVSTCVDKPLKSMTHGQCLVFGDDVW